MSREKIIFFIVFIFSAGALAYGNTLAIEKSLYWELRWLDLCIHLLAGFLIGLTYFSIWFRRSSEPPYSLLWLIAGSLIAALLVGIAWEVLEWWLGLVLLDSAGLVDTALDLLLDCVGATLAALFSFKLFARVLQHV